MKKIIVTIIIIFVVITAMFAQLTTNDSSILVSKKGIPILPQKGDFAIGTNASPFLSYLGNIFNNTTDNEFRFNNEIRVVGRYFVSDNTAIRIILAMDNSRSITRSYVRDDANYLTDPRALTEDSYKLINTSNLFDIALQKFRGYGRLRGFYGISLGFGISRTRRVFNYGNPMTDVNTQPSTTNFGVGNISWPMRMLESDDGVNKYIMAGLIGGVDYYFLPKICMGFEISLSAAYSWKSQSDSKYEQFNGAQVEIINVPTRPKGHRYSSLKTNYAELFYNSLYIMFNF